MARKAKYDWGKSRDGRYQKFETRISTKLTATASGSPYADSGYCDIAQCLSFQNRKLVRQGHVFKVKGMRLFTKDGSPVTSGKVGVLPRTWVMFNAYKKARSLWLQQAQTAFADVGLGNLPKYFDFKVLMDEGHYDNYAAGTDLMLPMDFDENMVDRAHGDWNYSQFNSADATSDQFNLHMLGRHKDGGGWDASLTNTAGLLTAGLIMAYQQSRGLPALEQDQTGLTQQAADQLLAGPFGSLTDTSDQQADIVARHTADNVSPPYDYDEYPGGPTELKEVTTVWTGRIGDRAAVGSSIPAFEAPLGLIRVEVDAGSEMSSEEVEVYFDTEIMGTI